MDPLMCPSKAQLPSMRQVISTCITTGYSRIGVMTGLICSLKIGLRLQTLYSVASRIWAGVTTHFRNLLRRLLMQSHSKFRNEVSGPIAKDDTRQGVHESDDCGGNLPVPVAPPPTREIIEVEFKEGARSGVEDWDFEKDKPKEEPSCYWQPGLREILERNNLVSWKPSFPLQYPWSRDCSRESARESYKKGGREKFVTFKFSTETDVLTIAKELRKQPEIAQAVAVPLIAPPCHPLEERYVGTTDQGETICGPSGCLMNQWYLFRCGVPEAWAQGASGDGVVIAAIDWGFDLDHPALSHTALSRNVTRNLPNVADGNLLFHGNGVLGLAGAAVNGYGMAGIAYGATLWAIQAGSGGLLHPVVDHSYWVAGINFVRTTPAAGRRKVIILELQTAAYSNPEMIPTIGAEIRAAIADGIVVCVPAGNGNRREDAGLDDEGIASFPETGSIVVGATRFDPETNPRAAGTNGGTRVSVYAPGDPDSDLTCGLRGGLRDNFGGTSGATAKVAGVVALMLEMNDTLTPQNVRDILRGSSKMVFDDAENAIGVLIDANQAVSEAIVARGTTEGMLSAARMEREAA
jgi:subtilisin family serine protease